MGLGGSRTSRALSRPRLGYSIVVLFVVIAAVAIRWRPAEALPSYARQTGQQCAACHNGFPELTPYGRLFKLNGYAFSAGSDDVPPIAGMVIGDFTHTSKDQAGGAAPRFGPNDNFSLNTASLFYAGKITDHLGAFIQTTYNQTSNTFHWDNTDIRYANVGELGGQELVYGVSVNNNPTVNDVWNTTPAWGYPYQSSGLAPTPAARTLIEGGLAQQAIGVNPYVYWNRLFYAEFGGYRTLGPSSLFALGIEPAGTSAIDSVAPSWRLAVEPAWGNNTLEVGTFGLSAPLVPQRMTGAGTDRLTDVGLDTQYQWLGSRDAFSLQARFIEEFQHLPASQALGLSTNGNNHLHTWQIKGSYWWNQTVGFTTSYFNIHGTPDAGLYGGVSANNSPNSNGWIFELNYVPFNYGGPTFWPWLNAKFGLQFVHYNKFNGARINYDGMGTNAADNDTVYLNGWFAF
jgi:hypothetical protein